MSGASMTAGSSARDRRGHERRECDSRARACPARAWPAGASVTREC